MCALLAALLLVWSGNGLAEGLLPREIRAQPLAAALAEFAHQTGLQLVYVSDVLKEQVSRGSRAGVSAADALTALLDGTGLTFEFLNNRAVRIFPGPSRPDQSGEGPRPLARQVSPARVLDEIDVTGSRDERIRAFDYLQNISSSVTLVSGVSLEAEKSEQLLDYAGSVPGMNILTPGAPGQPQVTIRGIYPFSGAAAVASYIDDTPIGATGAYADAGNLSADLPPYEIERLEVWRDPQGTSIGAESEIGLVRYVLVQPNLSEFHAVVAADVSAIHGADEPGESIFAAANLPIVNGQLAVRLSGYDNYTPGYVDNLYNGARGINVLRRYGGRVAVLWQATAAVTVTLNALRKADAARSWSQVTFNQVAVVPNTGNAYFVQQLGSWGDLLDNAALRSPNSNRLDLLSLSLHWTPGAVDVHSVTGWSRIDNFNSADETPAYDSYYSAWSDGKVPTGLALFSQTVGVSKFSEELHVGSSSARTIEWLVGGFYTRESTSNYSATQALDSAGQPIAFFAPSLAFANQPSTFNGQTLFGNVSWHLTARLELGAGIRRGHDEQSLSVANGAWGSPTFSFFGRSSEADTSWMASAKYRFDPSTVVYGRVATGFQPAFPNDPGAPVTLRGERTVSYELGLKGSYLGSRVLADLTTFYVDWKDIQLGAFTPDGSFYYANGAYAFSKGFEFTGSVAPLPELQLAVITAYTECQLESVIPAANYYLTGYQIPVLPKWTLTGRATYSWLLGGIWRAELGGTLRWLDQWWTAPGAVQSQSIYNYPAVVVPSYGVLDMNAQASRGPLTLRFFVRNLADKRAFVNRFAITDADNVPVLIVDKLLQPRTVGVGVNYSF